MTVSKQRLNEIALEVAKSFITEMEGYSYFGSNPGIPEDEVTDFALALIRRVEAETGGETNKFSCRADGTYDTFVQLPLVSEE